MIDELDLRVWSYYGMVYKLAKRILKCREQASDIASETILHVLQIIRSENPPELRNDPEPYIKKTAINLIRSIFRRNKHRLSLDEWDGDNYYSLNFDMFDLSNVLSDCDENVVKLTIMKIEGYNTKECADEFNINENSLKVRWHRTKKMLIEHFD